ncbi:hypothetical protein [Variovorax sp. GT1P44]|uniref:hypothetical protein n=1 Tax=Variovorax sp. GT1P44 TaxID=3443742 RepID=UPI003F45AE18
MSNALRSCLAVLVAAGGLVGASSALAQGSVSGSLVCDGVQQNKQACLREKGAAQQAARQGGLSNPDVATLQANALARCNRQPPEDRAACESRVMGTGQTNVTGSVLGGGVIRTTVVPVPAR